MCLFERYGLRQGHYSYELGFQKDNRLYSSDIDFCHLAASILHVSSAVFAFPIEDAT